MPRGNVDLTSVSYLVSWNAEKLHPRFISLTTAVGVGDRSRLYIRPVSSRFNGPKRRITARVRDRRDFVPMIFEKRTLTVERPMDRFTIRVGDGYFTAILPE